MQVSLRPFEEPDRPLLDLWAFRIGSEEYMSRYTPHPERCFLWCVIQADGDDVGTVWLERLDSHTVLLGIFLGDPGAMGQGIGSRAIDLALKRALRIAPVQLVRLNVRETNRRAIACYERCGFRTVASGTRQAADTQYDFLTMEKRLQPDNASATQ